MKLRQLIDEIADRRIVLPEFQREFVWDAGQSRELMKSLYRDYPIGSTLVWETDNPPPIKNDAIAEDRFTRFQVLLDGQQRLTVLYLFFRDRVPPYYNPEEIKEDPRDLHFNLREGTFHAESQSVRSDPEYVRLTEVFSEGLSPVAVAADKLGSDSTSVQQLVDLAGTYESTLGKLRRIPEAEIPVEVLPASAGIREGIRLFDRINSQGTHLEESQLALAHMSAAWPTIRRSIKEKQQELADRGFDYPLRFYVRCLVAVVTGGMNYETIHDWAGEELQSTWEKLAGEEGTFDSLLTILTKQARIPDRRHLASRMALVPFLVHLYRNDNRLEKNERSRFVRWLNLALLWRRYAGEPEATLEEDLGRLDAPDPAGELIDAIERERGRLTLEPRDLEGEGKDSDHLYNMVRILIRATNPIDWQTGRQLTGEFELEPVYVFPKSQLYQEHGPALDSSHVNELANRMFLPPGSASMVRGRSPADYLSEVADDHPSALRSQFIPEDSDLWSADNFAEFLTRRRDRLASGINDYLDSMVEASED